MVYLKRIAAVITGLATVVCMPQTGFAQNQSSGGECNYAMDVPYEYPVIPETQEWAALQSLEEKLEVCAIPEEVLSGITTEALLETVIEYPLLINMYAFDSQDEGLDALIEGFNGLRELLNREDAGAVIFDKYCSLPICMEPSEATWEDVGVQPFLERLLIREELRAGKKQEAVEEKITEQICKKMQSTEVYGGTVNKDILFEIAEDYPKVYSTAYTTVKTPKGTSVRVSVIDTELTQKEIEDLIIGFKKAYPNAKYVSAPTYAYNCHSYAWYSQSTSTNKYWMDDATAYMTDGSYLRKDAPQTGYKVFYSDDNHSGIVSALDNGIQVTSKWGKSALYKHAIGDCPYLKTNIKFYQRG